MHMLCNPSRDCQCAATHIQPFAATQLRHRITHQLLTADT